MITDAAGLVTRYHYDDQQQLIREDNPYTHKTYVYTYDRGGNRTSKTTYTYTTSSLTDLTGTVSNYTYEGDRLTANGSTAITYDELGNPLTYGPNAYTWQNGRQLASLSMSYGGLVYSFEYNDSGIRISKTSLGIKHEYTLNGSQIVTESWVQNGVEHFIVYLYDESGAPIGMQYRTSDYAWDEFDNYFFEKNLFGDVVAVYNEAGTKIGSYTYDAWGICTTSVQSTASTLEKNVVRYYNPFRYRGYFYDYDTGLYYLQSRYYNPQWGRFLNADGYINANGDLIGFNMYAYCSNNPVMYVDPSGRCFEWLGDVIDFIVEVVDFVLSERSVIWGAASKIATWVDAGLSIDNLDKRITSFQTQHTYNMVHKIRGEDSLIKPIDGIDSEKYEKLLEENAAHFKKEDVYLWDDVMTKVVTTSTPLSEQEYDHLIGLFGYWANEDATKVYLRMAYDTAVD